MDVKGVDIPGQRLPDLEHVPLRLPQAGEQGVGQGVQLPVVLAFTDKAEGLDLKGLKDQLVLLGEKDHQGVGGLGADAAADLDAVQTGHLDVQKNHIVVVVGLVHGQKPVSGGEEVEPHRHVPCLEGVGQGGPEIIPDNGVILHNGGLIHKIPSFSSSIAQDKAPLSTAPCCISYPICAFRTDFQKWGKSVLE